MSRGCAIPSSEWQDSYGVGNTLGTNVSPFNNISLAGTGTSALYYNTVFGYSGANPSVADPYTINTNSSATGTLEDQHRIHLDVTADFEGATLKLLSGYQQYTYFTSSDSDNTPRPRRSNIPVPGGGTLSVDLDGRPGRCRARPSRGRHSRRLNVSPDSRTYYRERQQWQSNEINVSSNGDGDLQWIVGLYQYSQKWDQPQGITSGRSRLEESCSVRPRIRAARSWRWMATWRRIPTRASARWIGRSPTNGPSRSGLRYTKDKKTGIDMARYVARIPATAIGAADAAPTLENAIIGLFPAGTPLAFIQTQVQMFGPVRRAAGARADSGTRAGRDPEPSVRSACRARRICCRILAAACVAISQAIGMR